VSLPACRRSGRAAHRGHPAPAGWCRGISRKGATRRVAGVLPPAAGLPNERSRLDRCRRHRRSTVMPEVLLRLAELSRRLAKLGLRNNVLPALRQLIAKIAERTLNVLVIAAIERLRSAALGRPSIRRSGRYAGCLVQCLGELTLGVCRQLVRSRGPDRSAAPMPAKNRRGRSTRQCPGQSRSDAGHQPDFSILLLARACLDLLVQARLGLGEQSPPLRPAQWTSPQFAFGGHQLSRPGRRHCWKKDRLALRHPVVRSLSGQAGLKSKRCAKLRRKVGQPERRTMARIEAMEAIENSRRLMTGKSAPGGVSDAVAAASRSWRR